jgi:uncharacterized membrane protein YebE (DUF533 family)
MFDARQLLDALVGATARRLTGEPPGAPRQGGQAPSPVSNVLDNLLGPPGQGGSADAYVQKVREFVDRNPRLAEAALTAVAGVLMKSRGAAGIAAGAARLGGLALIGVLAYKAYQNYQAGKPILDMGQGNLGQGGGAALPASAGLDPAAVTDDDALLFARAMVAAASADGPLDERERARIVAALSQAGIDPQATRWLDDELSSPADVEDIADRVQTPEKAAQVYAAARLAIDPDTRQEREFLRQLAEALDLDPALARQIDDAAASVRA